MKTHCMLLVFFLLLTSQSCDKAPNSRLSGQEDSMASLDVKNIQTIAFGSCNRENLSQEYWNNIVAVKPDLWIWSGDNIYGDSEDMNVLSRKYHKQKSNAHYAHFRSQVPIIGTWDDHDYGTNDGNRTYPRKEESKTLALDFLDVASNAAVRSRPGLYQSYLFGNGAKSVKVLLLDTRSFQDPLLPNPGDGARYLPSEGTLLGTKQWQWLSAELEKNEASVHIIVSSIQVLSATHAYEKWENFPLERQQLFELLTNTTAQNILFISGDRHIAEVSKLELQDLTYPVFDITASGLTHAYERASESNTLRVGPLIAQRNFGMLHFEWKNNQVLITVKLMSTDGDLLHEQSLFTYTIIS